MKAGSDIVTVQEVMGRLGVCRVTVYRWMKTGDLSVIRIGGRVLIRREPFERLMKGEEQPCRP